jgi:hypothetical protein
MAVSLCALIEMLIHRDKINVLDPDLKAKQEVSAQGKK